MKASVGILYLLLITGIALVSVQPFDFVVVGSGTAGCIVASRLSEDGGYAVLLLETGGDPYPELDIPALSPIYQEDPNVTFKYKSVPQTNASLARGGVVDIISGRLLGGTGSINTMFYNRGHPRDYDNWAELTQDDSWTYSNLLPYFKKIEDYTGSFPNEDQHGTGGPISVSNQSYAPGLSQWLAAGKQLNYSIGDPNGPQRISFTPVEYNKLKGKRVSTYAAYIKPYEDTRPNLRVVAHATVTKIIFAGNKTVGLRYIDTRTNTEEEVMAEKEVILSAGAYGSPILLQKSGIGPRDILEAAGIPVVKEIPGVGLNLQDHPITPMKLIINDESLIFNPDRDLTPENYELYQRTGEGPYSSSMGLIGQAFIASSVAQEEGESDWPDIHISMYAQNFSNLLPNASYGPGEVTIHSYPYLAREKSRGTVRIDPENVDGQPIIDFKLLEDPRDVRIMVDAMKMMTQIVEETTPYIMVGGRYPPDPIEACQSLHFRSDEYWECYVRQNIVGGNHAVGTNKMGVPGEDPLAVVDSKLKVIGLEGLRIIDASVIPVIVNANPQAAIMVIAEKGAEEILSDWQK